MKRSMSIQPMFLIAAVASVGVLGGCGLTSAPTKPVATPTFIVAPTQAIVAVTETPLPVATPTPITTETVAPTPTQKVIGTPTRQATATRTPPAAAGMMRVKIFFVALNDNGKSGKQIGCNDSIVSVERSVPLTTAPLTAALKELLSIHDRNYGQSGLYNSLYQSNLKVDSVSIVAGKATINLSGTVTLGGACDNPRFASQIQETALQFSTVKQVAVFINGIPLEKILSEKGG